MNMDTAGAGSPAESPLKVSGKLVLHDWAERNLDYATILFLHGHLSRQEFTAIFREVTERGWYVEFD